MASVSAKRLELYPAGFEIQRALCGECHGVRVHVDEPADLEQQHVVAVRASSFISGRTLREPGISRGSKFDRALHDADDVVPLVLG